VPIIINIFVKKPLYIMVAACLLLVPTHVFSQDGRIASQSVDLQVAGSALLAVAGPPVKLVLAGAVEAGDAIQESAENEETRLRISSLVNDGEARSVTAKISEELVGTNLYVELKTPNSNFVYPENMGTSSGLKMLSNATEETLIDGIGTCWSGKTEGDGYVIRYVFRAIPNAPVLRSTTLTVTYTISSVVSDRNE
jgi:hypothetical protein